MSESLSLELSLFRRQRRQIKKAVGDASPAFVRYEGRYRRKTRDFTRVVSPEAVREEVRRSDVVFVGDYHTLKSSQDSFLDLVRAAQTSGRRVVMALEFVEGRHQAAVDAFLNGRLLEPAFLRRIGHRRQGGYDLWASFRSLFAFARTEQLSVLAIDRRATGARSLAIRDGYAARRVASVLREPDRPLVLVLMGQFHVAPCHLPARVEKELGKVSRRALVVYQNCDGVYWELARRGQAERAAAAEIRPGELCLLNASPVVCQQSFLDYLDAEEGDEPITERAPAEHFRDMAAAVARYLGVDLDDEVAEVDIGTAATPDFLERVRRRGRLTSLEIGRVKRQILSRESYYIPRARMAYLASLSLNHAAEEATHFVRHRCVGPAMDRPRRASEAFWARCLEEALGFFGSKLVNPKRRCRSLDEWVSTFQDGRGEDRQIAAFVLALKAAETEGVEAARKLVPLRRDSLFHAVSHALGYLLGQALSSRHAEGRVSRTEIRALFRDPFPDPLRSYFDWARRTS